MEGKAEVAVPVKFRRKPRKVRSIYSYKAPKTERKEVDLEAYLIEQTPEPTTADVPSQTVQPESWLPLPDHEEYIPTKTGVDCATQVDTDGIFNFDFEVQPLLDVLVWKTLEAAEIEVEEEEEMKALVERRGELEEMVREEANRVAMLEKMEVERRRQAEEKMQIERERVAQETQLNEKLEARMTAKSMLREVVKSTYQGLRESGYFVEPVVQEVQKLFLPSLLRQAADLVRAFLFLVATCQIFPMMMMMMCGCLCTVCDDDDVVFCVVIRVIFVL